MYAKLLAPSVIPPRSLGADSVPCRAMPGIHHSGATRVVASGMVTVMKYAGTAAVTAGEQMFAKVSQPA